MPAIIALVLLAVVALAVLSFTVHILFSPWLLVAVAILAWIRFRPRRPRRRFHAHWRPASLLREGCAAERTRRAAVRIGAGTPVLPTLGGSVLGWLAGGDQGGDDLGQMTGDGVMAFALEGSQFGVGEMVSEPLSVKWGYVLVFGALPDGDLADAGQGEPPVAESCQAIVGCSLAP